MNTDDFEKRLERQTIRPIPGEWRQEILQVANGVSPSQLNTQNSTLKTFLSELLWPCPQAWAGLAAVWLVILTMNFATSERETKMAKATPPSPETLMAMREQRRLYLELADLHPKEADRPPKPIAPRPRSEGRMEFQIA